MAAAATEAADDQLVSAVRAGSEEAFEALFRRYRPRIVAYVRGMVSDHARAEDISQEAFMSALRGLRSSDQEISFRPWMYEIAKNACIDHLRRAGRGTEISIDSDDFSPQEEGRISQSVSGTDAEVARRKDLESLQMAFGDLPQSQHRILVMRELEGLSYDRIGRRMGISRGAVESLLFRARRTLRDGFDEIDTGERCLRMRVAMETVADGRGTGMRDRRRLTSHLRDCAGCRRTAVAIGLDELALAAARARGGALKRVAGLLPLPAFLRRRMDGLASLNSIGPAAEQGASLAGKATALVVAATLAAGGAGVATKAAGGPVPLPGVLGGGSTGSGSGHGDRAQDGGGAARGGSSAEGTRAGVAGGGPGAAGETRGPSGEQGANGRGDIQGQRGEAAPGALDGARGTAGELGGAAGGAAGGTTGTLGSLVTSPGKTIERTGEQATGLVDDTLQGVTGGKAPRIPSPKLQLPDTGVSVPGAGGGTSQPSVPDVGGTIGGVQSSLPVQTPGLNLPRTGATVPGTGVRLP